MKYLLDTNLVSELRKAKSGRANPGVLAWATDLPGPLTAISAVSLYELEYGVLLKERSDPRQGRLLRMWLDDHVRVEFAGRCLPVDDVVAQRAATFNVPDPAPFRDALIGATAIVHDLTVVSRNTQDFERFPGVALENPWT